MNEKRPAYAGRDTHVQEIQAASAEPGAVPQNALQGTAPGKLSASSFRQKR
jgi:hypothetical protein